MYEVGDRVEDARRKSGACARAQRNAAFARLPSRYATTAVRTCVGYVEIGRTMGLAEQHG